MLRYIHGLVASQGLAGPCDGELINAASAGHFVDS